ncbi:MAG: FliM/FliN family flagellar motor switch protein [Parvularculaceae bacterium]|nr:FliM/FliN family flagellar motor switch protein [Parvularculaceae bacterium]
MSEEPSTPDEQTDDEVIWNNDADLSDLLGFDLSEEDGVDRSGLHALINSALVSHRRLPMLDVVFDRTARRMSTSLRQLTDENVEVTLENVTSARFGDFVGAQDRPVVIGVIKARELDGYCLLTAEDRLVYSVVDLLLGGRRGANDDFEDRRFTPIELGLAQRMIGIMTEDFDAMFEPVAKAGFMLERIETTPRFAAISQNASVCALGKFRVHIEDFSGGVSILIPHATLEPVYDRLHRDFINDAGSGAEASWKTHINTQITAASVELSAVLADRQMTIRDLQALDVGETLTFPASPPPKVDLRAGGVTIGTGRVGRSGEVIAVRLDSGVDFTPDAEEAA